MKILLLHSKYKTLYKERKYKEMIDLTDSLVKEYTFISDMFYKKKTSSEAVEFFKSHKKVELQNLLERAMNDMFLIQKNVQKGVLFSKNNEIYVALSLKINDILQAMPQFLFFDLNDAAEELEMDISFQGTNWVEQATSVKKALQNKKIQRPQKNSSSMTLRQKQTALIKL